MNYLVYFHLLLQVAQQLPAGPHADARGETRSGMEHTAPDAEGPAGRRGNEGGRPRGGSRGPLFLQPVRHAAPGPVLQPVRRPGRVICISFLPSPLPFLVQVKL